MFGSSAPFGSNTGFSSSENQQNPRSVFSISNPFGNPTPVFGQTSTNMFDSPQKPPRFGSTTPTQNAFVSSGLFGQPSAPLLGSPNTSFGQANKTRRNSFSSAERSVFGQSSQPQANVSQPHFFGSRSFGSQAAQPGTVIKFSPTIGNDCIQKGMNVITIQTKIHSITCMKAYKTKSFEELRFEDYSANRKGPQQPTTQPFGATALPTFGATSKFGVPNQTSMRQEFFVKPTTAFGSTSSNPFGFQSSANNTFGATPGQLFPNTSQQSSGFGQSVFRASNQQQPSFPTQIGTYPATPMQPNLFQQLKSNTGFGGISSSAGAAFGQSQPGFNSTFAKPATNTFGHQQIGFGNNQTPVTQQFGFGNYTLNQTPAKQQIGFGSNTLNQTPVNNPFGVIAARPTFGTGNTYATPLLQTNNQPCFPQTQPFAQPIVSSVQTPEMQGLLNLADPYGLSPTHYVTNPKELEDVINKQDFEPTFVHRKKLKVKMPDSAFTKLFDEAYAVDEAVKKNFGMRKNLKQLIIKTPVKRPEELIVYQIGKNVDAYIQPPATNTSEEDSKILNTTQE